MLFAVLIAVAAVVVVALDGYGNDETYGYGYFGDAPEYLHMDSDYYLGDYEDDGDLASYDYNDHDYDYTQESYIGDAPEYMPYYSWEGPEYEYYYDELHYYEGEPYVVVVPDDAVILPEIVYYPIGDGLTSFIIPEGHTSRIVEGGAVFGPIYGLGGNLYMEAGSVEGVYSEEHPLYHDPDSPFQPFVWVPNSRIVWTAGTFTMSDGEIFGHTAFFGGAVFITGGTFNMIGGTIRNNYSSGLGAGVDHGGGGGVAVVGSDAVFNMSGTAVIRDNTGTDRARVWGGGVAVRDGATFTMDGNASIHDNIAGTAGGVHVGGAGSVFRMYGGTIHNNHSESGSGGGGIRVTHGGRFEMHGGVIHDNTASLQGGGVRIGHSSANPGRATMLMTGGTIRDNIAGSSGGGVHVNSADFYMEGGYIINNTSTSSSQGGGGVHVIGSDTSGAATFTMRGPDTKTIRGNHAGGPGGGILGGNHSATTVTMEGTGQIIVEFNTTGLSNGGAGVHINGGVFNMTTETAHVRNHNSTGTTAGAPTNGSGVFLTGGVLFYMSAGNITGNRALGTPPGGVSVNSLNTEFRMTGGIIGGSFENRNTGGEGGGVRVGNTATFNMSGAAGTIATISHNVASTAGGGVFISNNAGNNFNMRNAGTRNITQNRAPFGGGVEVRHGNFRMESGNNNIFQNFADNGGGINQAGGTVTMNEAHIFNHRYRTAFDTATIINGGGVRVTGSSSVFNMTGGVIGGDTLADSNVADYGGGVWVGNGATFNMQDYTPASGEAVPGTGRISANGHQATEAGGGVFIAANGTLNINSADAIIGHTSPGLGNTARRGGGISIAGTLNFTQGQIINNSAVGNTVTAGLGGGLHFESASATLNMSQGTRYINNNTSSRLGGGVHWSQGTWNAPLGPLEIMGNTAAQQGGGIHLSGGRVLNYADNWHISENTATSTSATNGGGGLYITGANTILNMHSGIIGANRASRGGGVMVTNDATFQMADGTISSHIHNATGGSITAGGGVYVTGANTIFTMTGGTIGGDAHEYSNIAASGGGVGLAGGATFNMQDNARISGNEATGGAAAQGGGGVHVNVSTFNMYAGSIYNNLAFHGGGVMIQGDATFNMLGAGTKIIRNNTANFGGGIMVRTVATTGTTGFHMLEGTIYIEANTRIGTNNAGGAGIHQTSGQTIMNVGTIRRHNASGGRTAPFGTGIAHGTNDGAKSVGAAARINGGRFTMNGGTFTSNHVLSIPGSQSAGAVSVYHLGTTFIMTGGTIGGAGDLGNQAYTGGGVLGDQHARIYISGGLITGNCATNAGGGVHINNTVLTISGDVLIENNRASIGGGGVWVQNGGTFNMRNGTIRNNRYNHLNTGYVPMGGGVAIGWDNVPSTFNMSGGVIGGTLPEHANMAVTGGGVFINRNSTFNMQDYTPAGGGEVVPGDGLIVGNIATGTAANQGGGGVFITESGSRFNMSAGTIYDNHANHGGGVYVTGSARFYIDGDTIKTITGNEAVNDGGGVWVAAVSQMTMLTDATNLRITDNIAGHMGGGIFTDDFEYRSPLSVLSDAFGIFAGEAVAYRNLTLNADTIFSGNSAYFLYHPPSNANTTVLPRILSATRTPNSPHPAHYHPLNNYDINFRGIRFEFLKTDYQIYNNPYVINLREGAHFRVFRTAAADVTPGAGLVTFNALGEPNAPWVELDASNVINMESTTNFDEPIVFHMEIASVGIFVYQIVEIQPPVGFERPVGQWRIQHMGLGVFETEIIGGEGFRMPVFRYLPCDCDYEDCERKGVNWFLGNFTAFNLPLTGSTGQRLMQYTLLGLGVIAIGLIGIFAVNIRKKTAIRAASSSRYH